MSRWWLPLLVAVSLAACGDDAGVQDAGPGDAGLDDAGLAGLVKSAIQAGCSEASLKALATANPAGVRGAIVALDRQAKVKPAAGYSYHNPLQAKIQLPEVSKYASDFTYTVYVPAGYTADPGKSLALWVDPSHPTEAIKDTSYLAYLSTAGSGKFLPMRVNFMNVLYQKMDRASYDALRLKGVAFEQDYFNVLDAAIAAVKRRYHVDPDKIFISGVSAKGASSWFHGIFSADQYAVIHPVSIIPTDFHKDLYLNLINVGVYVWQGDQDTITPISKVEPMITKIKGHGLSVFYYVHKGGGHGKGWYPATYMPLLLKTYTRDVTPERVHKGIKTGDNADAYWVEATRFTAPLPASAYKTLAPPALIDATWKGKQVTIGRLQGISELQIKWLDDASGGAGRGREGDILSVVVSGKTRGPYTLKEHPTVALEDYCRHADTTRLWAGRVVVSFP